MAFKVMKIQKSNSGGADERLVQKLQKREKENQRNKKNNREMNREEDFFHFLTEYLLIVDK